MRRFFALLILPLLVIPVRAETIKWVDFQVPYESLQYAMEVDIATFDQEKHISWIDILALSACRTGGRCDLPAVKKAAASLKEDKTTEELLGGLYQYYQYYHEAYSAALGGLLGSYAIEKDGKWIPRYGLKAFSPIAAGYSYSHSDDFGASRTFGYDRKHLGHDMMGQVGTPVIAIESGYVAELGWNQYGGWRVGINSFDGRRYYYYAHLRQNRPYAEDLEKGDTVQAGDVIGYIGRTGYSAEENVNNIDTYHLHFGLQLIFDESQREGNNEIWVSGYELVKFLYRHQSETQRNDETKEWTRIYQIRDPVLP